MQEATTPLINNKTTFEFWVYILICENNCYYTGYTTDLKKRYQSHVKGTGGCKYTRSFKPIKLARCWKIVGSKTLAMQLENQIKRLSRKEKDNIINQPDSLCVDNRISVYYESDFLVSTSAS